MKIGKCLSLCRDLRKIGIDKYEAAYCATKAYTCKGRYLGKGVTLDLIIHVEKITKKETIEKIRKEIPGGKTYFQLKRMKLPKKEIKEYMKSFKKVMKKNTTTSELEEQINTLWNSHISHK